MKDLYTELRKNFFTGLLVLFPLAVVAWMIKSIGLWLWGLYTLLPQSWQPESAFGNFLGFLVITLILFVVTSALGWTSKRYFGIKALQVLGHLIQRIPVLGTIYSSLSKLIETLSKGTSQQFRRVVYIEYPRKGMWVIGFVTGKVTAKNAPEKHLNVFLPTVPNPTSGFHLIVPEAEVRESGLTVEAAFRTILSLGIAEGD